MKQPKFENFVNFENKNWKIGDEVYGIMSSDFSALHTLVYNEVSRYHGHIVDSNDKERKIIVEFDNGRKEECSLIYLVKLRLTNFKDILYTFGKEGLLLKENNEEIYYRAEAIKKTETSWAISVKGNWINSEDLEKFYTPVNFNVMNYMEVR